MCVPLHISLHNAGLCSNARSVIKGSEALEKSSHSPPLRPPLQKRAEHCHGVVPEAACHGPGGYLLLGRDDFKDKIEAMLKRQTRPGTPGRPRVEEERAIYFAL
jgi:hypothetical protein